MHTIIWRIYFLLLIPLASLATEQTVFNHNHNSQSGTLRRFTCTTPEERNQVLRSALLFDLDVWQSTKDYVDIYTPNNDNNQPFPTQLFDIPHTTHIIQTPLRSSSSTRYNTTIRSLNNSTYHETYHPLHEINTFIQELAALHPDLVQLHNLGHSGEGREMLGITISDPNSSSPTSHFPGPGKLGFVIVGAQHAREWIATATATYLTHSLVSDTSEPHSLKSLLKTFDFHIIPTPNPDGYTYTWETDRYWYKNRQVLGPRLKCIGLDMNRNWGYKWKPTAEDVPMGISLDSNSNSNSNSHFQHDGDDDHDYTKMKKPTTPTDPCSHWYPGHRPFESSEVNNIANFVTTLPNLVGFLDLRSYGQMISTPYSYSCKRIPKDAEDTTEAALGAAHALKSIHGTPYEVGDLCHMLYPAPGNILDWMYQRVGIKYSYAVHLRDTGTYGFSLPDEMIRPVGEESCRMVEYLGKFIEGRTKRRSFIERMKDERDDEGEDEI